MGVVYLAREISLDRWVAIKVLGAGAEDPARVERFLSEARLAAKLRHPNIVSIHSVGDADGVRYFVMDFVEGVTLDGYVSHRGGLPLEEARSILVAICRAVGHAHKQGIVHRDLKPGNVMIDTAGHVLVMDFGLAKASSGVGVTAPGVIVGTPAYISPEQLQGRPASPRSDIYAIGLIYYFVLAGHPLIRGESITSAVAQHLSSDLASRVTEEPRVPADTRPLILSMIRRNSSARIGSLDEVVKVLERQSGSEARPPATAPLAPQGGSSPSEKKPSSGDVRKQARMKMKGLLEKLERKED